MTVVVRSKLSEDIMKSVSLAFAALALVAAAPMAHADVLTFDDLPDSGYFTSTYHGFSFGNLDSQTNQWFWSNAVDSTYPAHSGTTSVSTDASLFNGLASEEAMAITSATPFVFQGAYFSGPSLTLDGTPAEISFALYDGSNLVYTSAPSAQLGNVSSFIASGYEGDVTGVVVAGPQGYYAMDDFTFTAAVPEPGTMVMMLAGLGSLGLAARRRRQADLTH
jgi:hypothetical protein